jgi:D-lactate dehydrogenase (cytochrome)
MQNFKGLNQHFTNAVTGAQRFGSATNFFSVPRNPNFATVKDSDIAFFKDVCKSVLTEDTELKSFNTDWTKKWTGQSTVVVRPETTE